MLAILYVVDDRVYRQWGACDEWNIEIYRLSISEVLIPMIRNRVYRQQDTCDYS